MAAGSIVIDLLMKTGSFETDTKRAEKRLNELKKEAEKVGKAIGFAFLGATTAAALMVKSAIDSADAMSKLAQSTGTTVESISALTYAAGLSDVSQEELGNSLVKLTKNMSDASQGLGEGAKGFQALGLSVFDASGKMKNSDTILSEVAEKFASFEDGANKTALAVALFGRSGAKLIPLLNSGAAGLEAMKEEAASLGLVLDTETAKASEEFNDTLTRLGAVGRGLSTQLAAELLPTLQNVASVMFDTSKGSDALDGSVRAAAAGVKVLVSAGLIVGGIFKTIGQEIGGFAAAIGEVFAGNYKNAFNIAKETTADFYKNLKSISGDVSAVWDDTAKTIESNAEETGTKIAAPVIKALEKSGKAADAIQKKIADLYKSVATFGKSDKEVQLFDLKASGASPAQLKQADELLTTLEKLNAQQDYNAASGEAMAAAQKAIADQIDATKTPLEKLNDEFMRLSDLRDKGLDWGDYAKGIDAAQKSFEELTKVSDDFAKHAAENIQDAIGDGLVDLTNGSFSDIGKNFAKLLQRMAADAIAADIARKLFGANVSGGSGSGIFGGLLGSIGGLFGASAASSIPSAATLNAINLPSFAVGTDYVQQDMVAKIHKGERILTAEENRQITGGGASIGAGGGGINYAPVINIDSRTDRAAVQADVQRAVKQGNAELVDRLQRAGRL